MCVVVGGGGGGGGGGVMLHSICMIAAYKLSTVMHVHAPVITQNKDDDKSDTETALPDLKKRKKNCALIYIYIF